MIKQSRKSSASPFFLPSYITGADSDRKVLHWAVTTGGFNSETVLDVILGAVERRFGSDLPAYPVEWLTDNGSCYRVNETRQFARMLGLNRRTRRCGVRRVTA